MNTEELVVPRENMSARKISPDLMIDLETGTMKKNPEPTCREMWGIACGIGMGIILAFGFLGASIAYYVYCIMALVNDSHDSIQEKCSNSNIWPFILTVLIINLCVAKNTSGSAKDENGSNPINIFVSILILVSLCCWGSIEFWNNCVQNKLSDTLIFTMVKITVFMEYSFIFLLIALFIFVIHKALNVKK